MTCQVKGCPNPHHMPGDWKELAEALQLVTDDERMIAAAPARTHALVRLVEAARELHEASLSGDSLGLEDVELLEQTLIEAEAVLKHD